jgi:hypothetical protein
MAEKFTVIFDQAHSGAGTQVPFKNQTEASGGEVAVKTAKVAVIMAGTAQEAATAVRKAFGESCITGKVEVAKTSNVEEKTA